MAQFPRHEPNLYQGTNMSQKPTSTIDPRAPLVIQDTDVTEVNPIEKISDTEWRITLAEDPLNPGELILPLPQEVLDAQGWNEGDVMVWDYDEISGHAILRKQE
jgi:hypothetical protein